MAKLSKVYVNNDPTKDLLIDRAIKKDRFYHLYLDGESVGLISEDVEGSITFDAGFKPEFDDGITDTEMAVFEMANVIEQQNQEIQDTQQAIFELTEIIGGIL